MKAEDRILKIVHNRSSDDVHVGGVRPRRTIIPRVTAVSMFVIHKPC